ncbi:MULTISPECIES: hypothetical protein [unclassified Moraxella]|uniref:hypothetical protein n=1 Tax=unclassified Moraxella TaxID=2685852 RepID=UPI003AF4F673
MKITDMAKKLAFVTITLGLMSSAQAGFLDSINSIRNVVGEIGYTANTVTGAKNATKEMADSLGVNKVFAKQADTATDGGLQSGDMLVSKLNSVKLYANSNKKQVINTLSQADQLVYMGEEKNGFLLVTTDKGEGWVEKPLVNKQ